MIIDGIAVAYAQRMSHEQTMAIVFMLTVYLISWKENWKVKGKIISG